MNRLLAVLVLGMAAPASPRTRRRPESRLAAGACRRRAGRAGRRPRLAAAGLPARLPHPADRLRRAGRRRPTPNSSKFREYRAVPAAWCLPFLRFAGDEKVRYDVAAWNVLQDDARYLVRAGPARSGSTPQFVKIPHRFGNDARSLLEDTGAAALASATRSSRRSRPPSSSSRAATAPASTSRS